LKYYRFKSCEEKNFIPNLQIFFAAVAEYAELNLTYVDNMWNKIQCCGSESGSKSKRIQAFLAGTESKSKSEIFVPDSDSDPDSDPDPVPDPVI
jgi:hypothetical protein